MIAPRSLLLSAAVAAPLLLAACSKERTPAAAASGSSALPPTQVVATYKGGQITAGQMEEKAKPKLQELQAKMYEARRETLEQMAVESIVKAEAAKKGISDTQYFQARVEAAGVKKPSDAEIQQFYDQLKQAGRLPPDMTMDKIRDQLVAALTNQQRSSSAQKIIEELKRGADLKIDLPAPRVEVAAKGPSRGPSDAKVTIVEFSDFECPFCGQAKGTVDEVMQAYAGKVKLVYRQFPLPMHPHAEKAAEAALCANDQGKFWEYHDVLFSNQRSLAPEDLKKHAGAVGLDATRFASCLDSGEKKSAVEADMKDGEAAGVSGTPAFFVNGVFLNGAMPLDKFKSLIDPELASR